VCICSIIVSIIVCVYTYLAGSGLLSVPVPLLALAAAVLAGPALLCWYTVYGMDMIILGVVSVYMQYNYVYYCVYYYCVLLLYMQYNYVYYCDTYLLAAAVEAPLV
jgi:hypothetical protein